MSAQERILPKLIAYGRLPVKRLNAHSGVVLGLKITGESLVTVTSIFPFGETNDKSVGFFYGRAVKSVPPPVSFFSVML